VQTRNMTALTRGSGGIRKSCQDRRSQWEEVEPVPDSGVHGISFYHDGYLSLGVCLDNGMFDAHGMCMNVSTRHTNNRTLSTNQE
jgi:hypothetical protein